MVQDAADDTRVLDRRDQFETAPQRGHARTSNPKLRCMSSAHSQVFRGRCAEDAQLAPGVDIDGKYEQRLAGAYRHPAMSRG